MVLVESDRRSSLRVNTATGSSSNCLHETFFFLLHTHSLPLLFTICLLYYTYTMRKGPSVKPSLYPPLPFHLIRAIALLSSLVVGIIIAVFLVQLHKGGYKLPWAFLVVSTPYYTTSFSTKLTLPAHRRRRLLPHQLCPHHPRPLLLRPLPPSQPNHKLHPAHPLARRVWSPLLEHVPDHPHHLHHHLLGQLLRHHRLSHLQGLLLVHGHRSSLLHRSRHPRYHRAQAPDQTREIRSHAERRETGGSRGEWKRHVGEHLSRSPASWSSSGSGG